jgi:hypothetical protein
LAAFTFDAELWEHDGPAAWYFLSLPEADADAIEDMAGDRTNGFGSVRVEVTIGSTTWRTSIFPDTKRETFVLPVKKAVRVAEGLGAGTVARVELVVLD